MDRTAEHLASWKLPASPAEGGLVVERAGERTLVVLDEVDVPSVDEGRIVEVVRVLHPLPALAGVITPEVAARWNVVAGMTGLIAASAEAPPVLFSKFPVREGEEAAAATLYPLLAAAAAYQMVGVASYLAPGEPSAATFLAGGDPPGVSYFGLQDTPASSTEQDFAEPLAWAREQGLLATASATEVGIEVPWGEGNVGTQPATIALQTTRPHPLFGRGLFGLLRLPVVVEPEDAAELADLLNGWEANHADLSPTLGAWTTDASQSGLAFVSFVPGVFAYPWLPRHLAPWMAVRARRAREWLEQAGLTAPVGLGSP
jgi:hypothetical protein